VLNFDDRVILGKIILVDIDLKEYNATGPALPVLKPNDKENVS
jgi:hypothetical protein